MSKMRAVVVFEFYADAEREHSLPTLLQNIKDSCETMRVGFDAQECWVDAVTFVGKQNREDGDES